MIETRTTFVVRAETATGVTGKFGLSYATPDGAAEMVARVESGEFDNRGGPFARVWVEEVAR